MTFDEVDYQSKCITLTCMLTVTTQSTEDQSTEHACTSLPQRPSVANSYCNHRFAMRVQLPVHASGVLNKYIH